jgi:hypothetical protein
MFLWLSLVLFLHVQICVGYVLNLWSVWSFSLSFGLLMCHWGFTIAVLVTEGGLTLLSYLLWAACSSCIVCRTLLNVLRQLFLLILYSCLGIHIVLPPVLGWLFIFVTSSVQRRLWTGMILTVWHLFFLLLHTNVHRFYNHWFWKFWFQDCIVALFLKVAKVGGGTIVQEAKIGYAPPSLTIFLSCDFLCCVSCVDRRGFAESWTCRCW